MFSYDNQAMDQSAGSAGPLPYIPVEEKHTNLSIALDGPDGYKTLKVSGNQHQVRTMLMTWLMMVLPEPGDEPEMKDYLKGEIPF